jgi:hypothetical protein
LRAAVDGSVAWYQDVFAVHRIPTLIDGDLWAARAQPPRWHSVAKTLRPAAGAGPVLAAVEPFAECSVADSFGTLDLSAAGFDRLLEATWLHHPPLQPRQALPPSWSVVTTEPDLVEWNAAHDTTGVLLPALLRHPRFTFVAQRDAGQITAGAVLHDADAAVELSNAWSRSGHAPDPEDLLGCIAALRPRRSITGYTSEGIDVLTEAGFVPLGPHVVWLR